MPILDLATLVLAAAAIVATISVPLSGICPEVQIVEPGHSFQTTAGTWKVRFDAGHSPGHMSLMDHTRHLFIGVDFLLPRISPNISVALRNLDHDVLADYFSYLEEMCGLDDDWLVIPGHDWPFTVARPRASADCASRNPPWAIAGCWRTADNK